MFIFNPLSANPTKWSNTLKQFVGSLPTNCLSVSDHFVRMALKGLKKSKKLSKFLHVLLPDQNPLFLRRILSEFKIIPQS